MALEAQSLELPTWNFSSNDGGRKMAEAERSREDAQQAAEKLADTWVTNFFACETRHWREKCRKDHLNLPETIRAKKNLKNRPNPNAGTDPYFHPIHLVFVCHGCLTSKALQRQSASAEELEIARMQAEAAEVSAVKAWGVETIGAHR